MRSTTIVASMALACIGGLATGHATRASGQRLGWTPGAPAPAATELAAESGFYLRVEPARLERGDAGETLTLATRIGATHDGATRAITSVQIEDDRGRVVRPPAVSPRMSLAARSEIAGAELAVAPLPDGWYRLRAQAVFVEAARPTEALGSEADSVYLEVRGGEINIVDMNEWFAGSMVNLGRALP